MLKFNPTICFAVYAKNSSYVAGQGHTSTWERVESVVSKATENTPEIKTRVFYCQWQGAYGDRAMAAEAAGVKEMATLRMVYNPDIYAALRDKEAIIIKYADPSAMVNGEPDPTNPNTYELWGGVDNVREENQYLEFRVRRYTAK